jgi:putative DNA primase/helicase
MNSVHQDATVRNGILVPVEVDGVHDEFKSFDQWIAWKAFPREEDGKLDKVPFDVKTGRRASTTDSRTWSTFDDVVAAYVRGPFDGIGFVFSSGDPYTGIDLDEVRSPETGALTEWAQKVIEAFDAYVEVSPSGEGIHIYVKGRTIKARKNSEIEIYSTARFFTVTGVRP